MRSFVRFKPSKNGKIALSFTDIRISCTSCEFLTSQICLSMLFAKIKFSRKCPNLQYWRVFKATNETGSWYMILYRFRGMNSRYVNEVIQDLCGTSTLSVHSPFSFRAISYYLATNNGACKLYRPAHEILVIIAYAQKPPLNVHAGVRLVWVFL